MVSVCVAGVGANDAQAATVTLRPNGDVSTQWGPAGTSDSTCGGTHCSRVDEVSPNTADYLETPTLLGGNLVEIFDMGTAAIGQRATQVTVRTYVRSGFALPPLDAIDTITPSLWIGGTYIVGSDIEPGFPAWAWFDTVFTGSWSQSDIDAMRVRYVNNIKGLGLIQNNLQIATSEVVVTYTTDATVAQSVYRTYQNTNTPTPGTPLAAQNAAADTPGGTPFRLRIGLGISGVQLLANSYLYKLQYAPKSGVCDTSFTGETYTDVATTGAVRWYDTPALSSGAAITNYASDPNPGGPIVHQSYQETSPFTNLQAVPVGSTGLWDMALMSTSQTVGSYCFRVVKSDGQLLAAYVVVPEIAFTGSLDIDLVDAVGQPALQPIAFSSIISGSSCQGAFGTLGTNMQRIRITNNSSAHNWTASVAPTAGPTALWSGGAGKKYDINDPAECSDSGDADSYAGRLTINPSAGTVAPYGGCTTTGITLSNPANFLEGTSDAIGIASASVLADRFCSWAITGVAMLQSIPAGQPIGSYDISMTLTVVNP